MTVQEPAARSLITTTTEFVEQPSSYLSSLQQQQQPVLVSYAPVDATSYEKFGDNSSSYLTRSYYETSAYNNNNRNNSPTEFVTVEDPLIGVTSKSSNDVSGGEVPFEVWATNANPNGTWILIYFILEINFYLKLYCCDDLKLIKKFSLERIRDL